MQTFKRRATGVTNALCSPFCQVEPLDKVTLTHHNSGRTYAFVRFKLAGSVGYNLALMEGITLYDQKIRTFKTNG